MSALHSALDHPEAFWLVLTSLGRDEVFIVVLALYSWLVNPGGIRRLGLAFSLSYLSNTLLKFGFNLPRPFVADPELATAAAMATAAGPGLPSGHAQQSAALWLGMAWQLVGQAGTRQKKKAHLYEARRLKASRQAQQELLGVQQAAQARQEASSKQLLEDWNSEQARSLVDAWALANTSHPSNARIPRAAPPPQAAPRLAAEQVVNEPVYSGQPVVPGWIVALSLILVLTVSLSRLVLGVHYLADVLAGLLLGVGFAWLAATRAEWVKKLLVWNVWAPLLALLLAAALPSTAPREYSVGLGLLAGFWLLRRSFSAPDSWPARLGVAVAGLLLVFAVYIALSVLPQALRDLGLVRALKYGLLVLMAGEGVPRLFSRWMPETDARSSVPRVTGI